MNPSEFGFAVPRPAGSVPEIEEDVREAVRRAGGRLTYAQFLEICLYHPARGYYAAFGPETDEHARHPGADYFTSVDLHPAFGHLVAREVAVHLGHVARRVVGPFRIVEFGAGRGLLARDILQALSAEHFELAQRVHYVLVEPNPGWVQIQRRNLLPEFAGRVEWVRCAGPRVPFRGVAGVVVANELLDALPFHVVEGAGEGPLEVFVRASEEGPLEETLSPVSDPAIRGRLEEEGIVLESGQRGEVSLEASQMGGEIARAIGQGAVLMIDYGEQAQSLYDARTRPRGTMRCFFRHRLNEQPLERLGRQDITAHVDFTALAAALEGGGLKVHRLERQADFLDRHGLEALLSKLEADQPRLEREVYVRHRRALEALHDPKGLGKNLVLVAWR